MKRTVLLLTAAMLCISTFSCSNKKDAPESETPEVTTEAAENDDSVNTDDAAGTDADISSGTGGFRELSFSDFKTVNVKYNKMNEDAPVELNNIVFKNNKKRRSPCTAEDVIMDYMPEVLRSALQSSNDVMGMSKDEATEYMISAYSTPTGGNIVRCAVYDGFAYLVVNYDYLCQDFTHDYEIMSLALNDNSAEPEVLYSYSSLENGITISGIYVFRDELFIEQSIADGESSPKLYRVNNGELELVIDEEHTIYENTEGRLIVSVDENPFRSIREYDFDTGEWNELFQCGYNNDFAVHGSHYAAVELNDEREVCVCSDLFRLQTDIRGGHILGFSDDKVFIYRVENNTYTKAYLYTYDFSTMECYYTEIVAYGEVLKLFGEHILLTTSDRWYDLNYFVPELGASFTLPELATDLTLNPGSCSFTAYSNNVLDYDSSIENAEEMLDYYSINNIYWFSMPEQ